MTELQRKLGGSNTFKVGPKLGVRGHLNEETDQFS